jgi:hypothetical protein
MVARVPTLRIEVFAFENVSLHFVRSNPFATIKSHTLFIDHAVFFCILQDKITLKNSGALAAYSTWAVQECRNSAVRAFLQKADCWAHVMCASI